MVGSFFVVSRRLLAMAASVRAVPFVHSRASHQLNRHMLTGFRLAVMVMTMSMSKCILILLMSMFPV